jgi:hypothetical protein
VNESAILYLIPRWPKGTRTADEMSSLGGWSAQPGMTNHDAENLRVVKVDGRNVHARKAAERPKLSDPAHGTPRLQPERDGRVRCSALILPSKPFGYAGSIGSRAGSVTSTPRGIQQ